MLEAACALLPEPEARLLQVSDGFAYTVRTDVPTPLVVFPANIKFDRIDGQRRVASASLNGQAIDPEGRYTIAMPKGMLVSGGWSMPVPENAGAAVLVGTDNECLLNYVQGTLAGTIGQKYGNAAGAGRITIVEQADGETGDEANDAGAGNNGAAIAVAAGVGAAAIAVGIAAVKAKGK